MKDKTTTRRKARSIIYCVVPIIQVAFLSSLFGFERNVETQIEQVNLAEKPKDLLSCVVADKNLSALKLGKLYKQAPGPDCQKLAFMWFSKAAERGEVRAYAELANAYSKGRGVETDYEKSLEYYYKSARHNYVSSAFRLIYLVERGATRHPPNRTLARQYLNEFMPLIEKGISSGNAVAARSLARLYHRSELFERDINKAVNLYKLAAEKGDKIAKHDLALILLTHYKNQTPKSRIMKLLNESAELGYPAAFTALGRLHLKAEFDLAKTDAPIWFERGAEGGHGGAMQELAKLYVEGVLVEKDMRKAVELARQGAELGHQGSKRLLVEIQK